ncbi:helix-turn-helix domain-containing protein [Solihabitans fulvus]|uniref:Helix-turn-helix domain-containing protein n=1 Tax=Solihabitans fulvus TaxID=1892852 RepID=A0A5B2WWJ1_9PSEU|nr:helix-turn-helix transcriptional regulator [Solihabitans fulvus]KAA2255240.1 helix-turn-helix domain-containing protein [Solihabitans fulvus]
MPRMTEHTFRERQFGRELRRLRKEMGFGLAEAGRDLQFSVAKMSRIELGQLPTYHELLALLDRYGILADEWPPYIKALERAAEKGWWRIYGAIKQGLISMEDAAELLCELEMALIPGPFQSVPYMHAVFANGGIEFSRRRIEKLVALRLRRRERFTGENPLRYHGIIDESVLTNVWGSRQDMRDQLRQLVTVSSASNITLQVMPRTAGIHHGRLASFRVFAFPDPEEGDQIHMENIFRSVYVDDPEDVQAAKMLFKRLAVRALNPEESVLWIERLIAEI